jgi:microcin C transport system permease protein
MDNQDAKLKDGKNKISKIQKRSRFALSPINQRRKANFKKNRRGYWAMWIFMVLFLVTLAAEFLANDRPIIASIDGKTLYPIFVDYEENDILEEDPFNLPVVDFRAPHIEEAFQEKQGWMIWPPIRYSYRTINKQLPEPAPAKPFWLYDIDERCNAYLSGVGDSACNIGNWNWLGTDDQGRDVLARVIYGFRISILFGLILTLASAVIGVSAGAIQGYFGGWVDLIFQRIIEIWSAMPLLYLLLIVASILEPGFWILLGIMLMFSWVSFVGVVRAEFFRARNLEYVKAARALGVGNITIMFRHMLPNAMVATLTFLPFILSGSITTLTSLDFLGFGLPPGSASLGELLQQGKNNLESPWLGISGFIVISLMLSLLVFIGEATRDAFDPRKTFE